MDHMENKNSWEEDNDIHLQSKLRKLSIFYLFIRLLSHSAVCLTAAFVALVLGPTPPISFFFFTWAPPLLADHSYSATVCID